MFTNEEFEKLTEDPVSVEHIEDGRWDKNERIIFVVGRKFYQVIRTTGLTEYQDYPPEWSDYKEVKPVSVTTTQWIEVK